MSFIVHKLLVLGTVGQIHITMLLQALYLRVATLGELALWVAGLFLKSFLLWMASDNCTLKSRKPHKYITLKPSQGSPNSTFPQQILKMCMATLSTPNMREV